MQQYNKVIGEKLQEFVQHATYYVRHSVGRCEPLSRVFNATRDSVCVKIVQPVVRNQHEPSAFF